MEYLYSWVRVQSRIKQTALKKHDFKMQPLAEKPKQKHIYIYMATYIWQLIRRKRTATFEQSLALPLKAEIGCGRCCVLCPGTPGVMAAGPSALWKSCLREVSQTRRGRGRSAVCLWMKLKMESACGAGAEPSLPFPNGEDWTFPPAPYAEQLSKQLGCHPPSGALASFIL